MSQVIQKTRLNRFHAISSYVHSMHVLLAVGTLIAPAVALIADPPPVFMWVGMMLAVLYISMAHRCWWLRSIIPIIASHVGFTRQRRGKLCALGYL